MAGELITDDLQYQIGNLVVGPRTPYVVQKVTGLDVPPMNTYDNDIGGDDGAIPGEEFLPPRYVEMDLAIHDDPPYPPTPESVTALTRLFGPVREGGGLVPFTFRFRGLPILTFDVRPRRIAGDVDVAYHRGTVYRHIQLFAPRPYMYEDDELTEEFNLASGATSMSRTFQSATSFLAPFVVTIDGPARNPRLTNSQAGMALRIDVDIPAGQSLVIDALARTVLLNGVDVYGQVRHDNEWWRILRGSNSITFSRSSTGLTGAAAKATIKYRNVRLGV